MDGAFQSGLREAERILNMSGAPSFQWGSKDAWRSTHPETEHELRRWWWQLVQTYVL